MAKLGQLTAKIGSLVWGTPENFNGFRVLAALLYGTLVVGVSQAVALNRGRHLYSAGRAVATFEATEAAASVVFRTIASVKTITMSTYQSHHP